MSASDSTTVYCIICQSASAEIDSPASSSIRASTYFSSLPTNSIAIIVPAPLGAVTRPVVATG